MEKTKSIKEILWDVELDVGVILEILEAEDRMLFRYFEKIGVGDLFYQLLPIQQLTESSLTKLKKVAEGIEEITCRKSEIA